MALIFDSHCHYDDKRFDDDRDEVLSSLINNGVGAVLCAGCTVERSRQISELCKKYPFVFGSAGVHPIDCIDEPLPYLDKLGDLFSNEKKLLAVGEIGLDYHYDRSPKELQKKFFKEQLELAAELKKPVTVHLREATQDGIDILKEYKPKGVLHCFSGSRETARQVLDLGMYIGFTGVITFNNAERVRSVAEYIPLDRLLIETDCPYMAPVPFRGQRCVSSMLTSVADTLAAVKGVSSDEIIEITYKNAVKVYEMEGLL